MLNRQRILLALLGASGGSVSRIELVKLAFLLREETPSCGGSAFYQFLPYKHGPYSFSLQQEAASLVRDGYLTDTSDREWSVSQLGRAEISKVPKILRAEIDDLVLRFKGKPTKELVSYVYRKYKWFTLNSVTAPSVTRPTTQPAVYTAGYEGLHVDGFLDGLLRAGIQLLIDVRNNPVSRRFGFHRSTLKRLCENVGIEYRHFPELGIRSEQRQHLETQEDYTRLFDHYSRTTLRSERSAIRSVGDLLQSKAGVLVCMEADHQCCHRSALATQVSLVSGLEIVHLGLGRCTKHSNPAEFLLL